MAVKTYPHDSSRHLETPADEAVFLDEFFREGDLTGIADVLGIIARARGMTAIAREAGISRDGLYDLLRDAGNADRDTVLKVLAALGLKVPVAA